MRDIIGKKKKVAKVCKESIVTEDGGSLNNKKQCGLFGRFSGWDVLVGLLYVLIVVAVTWPLVNNLGDMVPGMGDDSGDTFHFLWNMWWFEKVVAGGHDVFYTSDLFFPNGVSLVYHTLTLSQGLIVYLLSPVLTMVEAFNVVYLLFMFLSAYCMYVLAYWLWSSRKGAFLAGLIFAFSPYVMAHSLGHFNLTVIWPFPLIVMLLLMIYRKPSWSYSIWLGLLVAFLFYNDFHYFLFAVLIAVVFAIYYSIRGKIAQDKIRLILQLGLVGVVVLLLVFPMLIRSLLVAEVYVPSALLSEVSYWSADVLAFFVPSFQNPIWGDLATEYMGKYDFGGVESVVYVGWVVLGMLVVSFVWNSGDKKKESQKWLFVTLLTFAVLMSLGPFLKYAGKIDFNLSDLEYSIPLPYLLFYKIPYLSVARVPARFYVLISLCAGILSAYSFGMIEQRIVSIGNGFAKIVSLFFVMFLVLVLMLDYAAWPMSMQDTNIPVVYDHIKEDSGSFTVLELPLWWTSGHRSQGKVITKLQYYQTYHEKRILNGSVSRVPNALFDYYLSVPGIKYLIDVKNNIMDSDDLERMEVLEVLRDDLDVKYIVVHEKYFDDDEYFKIRQYLENILDLSIEYEGDGQLLYQLY